MKPTRGPESPHQKRERTPGEGPLAVCGWCGALWPCPSAREAERSRRPGPNPLRNDGNRMPNLGFARAPRPTPNQRR
jgi:hypothetical protein